MNVTFFRRLALSSAIAVTLGGNALAETVFTVQLGSFESEKEARSHWKKLQKRFPDLFEPLSYASAKVQLPPDDFMYFRTQAGPIGKRVEADDICKRLTVQGFECYVAETAMFMADGNAVKEEKAETPKQMAEATVTPPPPPPPLPDMAVSEKTPEKVDLMEAEDLTRIYTASAPAKPLPAPKAPVPLSAPAVVAAKQVAAQKAAPTPAPAPMPWTDVATAPQQPVANAAPTAGGFASSPFQRGESNYAKQGMPAPMPMAPSPAPIPAATGEMADLKVAEAVPVPLGNIPAAAPAYSYTPSAERGYPSQQFARPSLWAEISYFSSQQAALGYWRTLHTRDNMMPQGLRLRVVKPLQHRYGREERLSLRVGPFDNANAIRRLCANTAPEKLRCQAMRDIGSSISSYGQTRSRLNPADAYARRQAARMAPPTTTSGGEPYYWVQLGSYPTIGAAQQQWSVLKSTFKSVLATQHEQIQSPGYSSASRPMYRLRIGPFARNIEANNTCNALKRGGTPCLVIQGK